MGRNVPVSPGFVYDLGHQLVWCPKYRRPVLTEPAKDRCAQSIRAQADEHSWQIVAFEIIPDHARLLVKAHPAVPPSYVANQFMSFASRMPRQKFAHLRSRLPTLWSRLFLAAVGVVPTATVKRYLGRRYERRRCRERQR